MKLTNKQEIFCLEYIKNFNATEAYMNAGYATQKKEVARVEASKLLTKPNILKKIEELKQKRIKNLEMDAEWILKEAVVMYKIAIGEEPFIVSYIKDGIVKKEKMYKTNLRDAIRLLEIIGKHVSVNAFKQTDDFETYQLSITLPDELTT